MRFYKSTTHCKRSCLYIVHGGQVGRHSVDMRRETTTVHFGFRFLVFFSVDEGTLFGFVTIIAGGKSDFFSTFGFLTLV